MSQKLFQGKFIRIHFDARGKLASADIETCKNKHPPRAFTNSVHVILLFNGIQ